MVRFEVKISFLPHVTIYCDSPVSLVKLFKEIYAFDVMDEEEGFYQIGFWAEASNYGDVFKVPSGEGFSLRRVD